MEKLLNDILSCELCSAHLPLGPRPVLQVSCRSRIIIIGQAPGKKVHESGIPWDDASGERLRDWLGVSREAFYDAQVMALIPMGFCYPGTGKSGDLPPRPECAEAWHRKVLQSIEAPGLTLLIGQYAQKHYLEGRQKSTLTETVRSFADYLPTMIPLPHPSPRNNIWLKKNPWFEEELLPSLRECVEKLVG